MRRKDREVTDEKKLEEIIGTCSCCRVGFVDEGQVYIVPLNFGYICEEGSYVFYFHSARQGRKIELMKGNPTVGFEMDAGYELKTSASACGHSAYFRSIIGQGTVCMVEDMEEKREGLRKIMERASGSGEWEFQDRMLEAVCVWKLMVTELTGKENIRESISSEN